MTTTQLTPNGILGLTQHVEEPSEGLDLGGKYSTYVVLIASDRENIPAFLVINRAHYFESGWDRDWMTYIDRWTAIEPQSASPIWSDPPLIQTPPSNKPVPFPIGALHGLTIGASIPFVRGLVTFKSALDVIDDKNSPMVHDISPR
ncbi:hypothetical protein NP233_g312 [Leucocoprinus birnbaumii]|uniref:Uncharacterized protein n=1 Tax=Leucocoprinus birnbaumii TaxID=56174 RepID=A0AAD5YWT4_9AGAR|nr:hypothetical protein NP233_g312 [Leucocoprinus birnbaumii]